MKAQTKTANLSKAEKKKKRGILILRICLIVLLSFIISSFAITKIIYDKIFTRYDAPTVEAGATDEELTTRLWQTTMSVEEWEETYANCYGIREPLTFTVEKNELQGYLYRSSFYGKSGKQAKYEPAFSGGEETVVSSEDYADSIVVIAPGMHADCDAYLPVIDTFLSYGYDVFIFDPTGCCHSEGKSQVGFSQELLDLEAAVKCVKEHHEYENLFLFGHSRGGYAVCAYETIDEVTAVVSVSGINSAMDAIMGKSVEYVGPAAYGNYPFLLLYQMTLFKPDVVTMQMDDVIEESGIPTLIIQGADDTIAPVDEFSIYSHKDEIEADTVEYDLRSDEGASEHTNLMYDSDGTSSDDMMETIHTFFEESRKAK